MKQILLAVFGVALCAVSIAQTVQRTVLVEEFTNASCGPCASQNPAFDALLAQNTTKTVVIKYQTNWPGYDPMNEQTQDEVQVRVDYYAVNGVPFAATDGVGVANDCNAYAGAPACLSQMDINNAYAVPAKIDIDLTHELSADLGTITVNCTIVNPDTLNEFNVADARLRVGIVEKVLKFPFAPGSNGEEEFFSVMRKMLPDPLGTLVGAIAPGGSATFTWTVPVPSYIYNFNEIGVVAFVQAQGAKTVYQAAVSEPQPLPGAFPDAGVAASTLGNPDDLCDLALTPQLTVTNDGGIDLTSFDAVYVMNGGTPVVKSWTGTLAPGASQDVTFDPLTLSGGETVLEYGVTNLNGGAQDINTLNNIVAAEFFYKLSETPIGFEIQEDLEDETVEGIPTNSIVARASILDLMVVNKDWLVSIGATVAAPQIGGYAQSATSILAGLWWTAPGTVTTMTFDKLDWTDRVKDSLTFDLAYRQYQAENDRLEVLVSTDCGNSWDVVYDKAGGELSTVGPSTSFFAPTAAQWATEAIDLTAYDDVAEVIVQFKITADFGNNMFLDNINLGGSIVSSVEDVIANGVINVYPNPASAEAHVDFNLSKSTNLTIGIYDTTGKLVETLVDNAAYSAGNFSTVWKNPANTGLYFVKIKTDEGEITKRLSVVK